MNILNHDRKIEIDAVQERVREEKKKLGIVANMRGRILAATTRVDEEHDGDDDHKALEGPTDDPYEIWNGGWRDLDENSGDRDKMRSIIQDFMAEKVESKASLAAKLVEEGLYRIAKSLEEYKELYTLETRIDELIIYMEERFQMKKERQGPKIVA